MKKKLSTDVVAKASPQAKPYEIRDTDLKGLLLRVQPSGAKSFVVSWARGQRSTLGRYPVMTVSSARAAALAALSESAQHGAPLAVIEANKPASERPITLGEFIKQHFEPWALAHQRHGQATLTALNACFSDLYAKELRDVVAFDLERFKTRRRKAGRTPATINRDLDRIRKVFNCAVEWGFLPANPLKTVKRSRVDNAKVRYLSADEERRLRKALADREAERRQSRELGNAWCKVRGYDGRPVWPESGFTDHVMPMVLLALNTGMRRGEIFKLAWRSVHLDKALLTVVPETAKSGKTRHLPLNAEALDVLKRWRAQSTGDGLVFPSVTGASFNNINKAFDGIVTAAKLDNFTFHCLRHDFASKLVMNGVDLNTVRELMGHADIKMTLRYAHLAPGKLAEAVAKLGAK